MEQSRFEELCESLRLARAVRDGRTKPSRVWELTRDKDRVRRRRVDPEKYRREQLKASGVSAIRGKLGFSQQQFADLLGISIKTLHNWEQGRRKPTGAARVLLRVASLNPEAVLAAAA